MLHSLIFLLISTSYTSAAEGKSVGCRTNSSYEPARKDESYQPLHDPSNLLKMPKFDGVGACQVTLENLQEGSLKQIEQLKNSKEFQEVVAKLETNGEAVQTDTSPSNSAPNLEQNFNEASLNIFVSFSMGEKSLLHLAHEAKQFGATLVLRGFKDGSYFKTAKALQEIITKTGQGVLIDPELYDLFGITAIPAFVLSKPFQLYAQERTQTPIHDKLQGHVSVRYALEQFAKEGDLTTEAQTLLMRGVAR